MIAVKLHGENEQGIPAAWPLRCAEGVETLPDGYDLLLEDAAAYNSYRAEHQGEYDAWQASQPEQNGERVRVVTPRQIRLWLIGAGIQLSDVEAMILTPAARVEWEYASEVLRDHPLVSQLSSALGLNEAQTDAAFLAASKL